jgi:hypothetical protein
LSFSLEIPEIKDMSRYTCIDCAINQNSYNPAIPDKLIGTQYQLDKFLKHTAPASHYTFNSVFTDSSTVAYRDYIVSAVSSGYVEVDSNNRLNIVWVASKDVGITYQDGLLYCPSDAVKVVFHDNEYKIHAFPIPSSGLTARHCIICGKPIF